MENYEILETLGFGSFGTVSKAQEKQTGEIVAIKVLKKPFNSFEECVNLTEIKVLKSLKHDNIIMIKEIFRQQNILHVVFEYMEKNLFELVKLRHSKPLTESNIRSIMHQTVIGLEYMHKMGYFHRDLKPENILVRGSQLKIADFGLAREIRSKPPFTDYVSTRWYRAPECILRSVNYSSPIDIWALGCIMIELYTQKPIFPGNTEKEVVYKMCSLLGTPSLSDWQEGYNLAKKIDFKFPYFERGDLQKVLGDICPEGLSLINDMLKWNPRERPNITEIRNHHYFTNFKIVNRIDSSEYSSEDFDRKSFYSEKENQRPKFRQSRESSFKSKATDDDKMRDTMDLNKSEQISSNCKFEERARKRKFSRK